jgi:polygalacturonase
MGYKRLICISTLCILLLIFLSARINNSVQGWEKTDKILGRIVAPSFPDIVCNIIDFGAVAGGEFDCTNAITNAINSCYDQGGGKVIIPEGIYLTGSIHLKSNVNLHLETGARLLFSQDPDHYLPIVHARFEGNDLMNYSPFIYAKQVENIAITGSGVLDGNADTAHWWPWKGTDRGGWNPGEPNQNTDRARLIEMSNQGIPYQKRVFGEGHYIRVNFIQFIEVNNILIDGVTIVNSPMWEINPVLCKNITVKNITVVSHGPNNDGCNPESCNDVLIDNCYFDTGDDCVSIKSGREEDGRKVNIPSENIIIRNCQMKEGHGGVVIGSEISGGCRNVFVENCTMDSPNLDRALRIKSNSLRGGTVENIYMRNITIGQVREAVVLIDLYYAEGDVGNYAPVVRDIFIDNVTSAKSDYALYILGYERSPVSGIHISNCHFNGVKYGNVLSHVKDLTFTESTINNTLLSESLCNLKIPEKQ